jgi:hypothetical protein
MMVLSALPQILRTARSPGAGKVFVITTIYLLMLGAVARHLYQTPLIRMDSIQYMGNALLMENTDIIRVHDRVYSEVRQSVAEPARSELQGHQADAPKDQNASRELRSHDAYRFAEFLPMFAIRPLYNQLIYFLYKSGVGLLRSTILISVASYFLLGAVIFAWIRKYSNLAVAFIFSLLLMLSPPMVATGRENISDALATLVAFTALYLIFESEVMTAGLALLLAAIYFRTDFVVLAAPVLIICLISRKLSWWQTAALGVVAVSSVLAINYCAGDYGIKMLYYRNFVGTPSAPGEMTAQFAVRDYASALKSGVRFAEASFFLPFLLLGITGLFREARSRAIFGAAISYALLHFILLPNWQERWFVLFYVSMGVVAAMSSGKRNHQVSSRQAGLQIFQMIDVVHDGGSGIVPDSAQTA